MGEGEQAPPQDQSQQPITEAVEQPVFIPPVENIDGDQAGDQPSVEGVSSPAEVAVQSEVLVRNAQEVLDQYFKRAMESARDIDGSLAEFRKQSGTLTDVGGDLRVVIAELEELERGGTRMGDSLDEAYYMERQVTKAQEAAEQDRAIIDGKKLTSIVDREDQDWRGRGGIDQFTKQINEAVYVDEPTAKAAAFQKLRDAMDDLGVSVSGDARRLSMDTDDFHASFSTDLIRIVGVGFNVEPEIRRRIDNDDISYDLRRRVTRAAEGVQDFGRIVNQKFEEMPSEYFRLAQATDRMIEEIKEILSAAEFLRPTKEEDGSSEDGVLEV
jgi:hypothetical protein